MELSIKYLEMDLKDLQELMREEETEENRVKEDLRTTG